MENHIIELTSKYLNRTIDSDDFDELKEWISSSAENRAEFETILYAYKYNQSLEFIKQTKKEKSKKILIAIRSAVAVLVCGLMIGTVYIYKNNFIETSLEEKQEVVVMEQKSYNNENSLIIKEDGKIVNLKDSNYSKIVVSENCIDYSKNVSSTEKYQDISVQASIKIPKGKRFQLILSDGTKVFINSDSYVEYQSKFQGDTRRIKVIGEVYLDVAHNTDKPFIVELANAEIKVLGTKFNVSAYPTNVNISTTLVEGSILFNNETKLSPNEKLTFNKHTLKSDLQSVDASEYISWIDGIYRFDNIALHELVTIFNRVYDVNINILSNKSINKLFTGAIHSNIAFEEMFKIIMKTTNVEYIIEKEKIEIW